MKNTFSATILGFYLCLAGGVFGETDISDRLSNEAGREAALRRVDIQAEIEMLDGHRWAGKYYYGDGTGINVSLRIAPEAGYLIEWHGCQGLYDRNYGDVRVQNGKLKLSLTFSNNQKGFEEIAEELHLVAWGGRTYLIPEKDMLKFCDSIDAKQEPRRDIHGFHLLKCGDEKKKVTGLPTIPEVYERYLLNYPVAATITAIDTPTPSGGVADTEFKDFQVTLNAGKESGLFKGMTLYVIEPDDAVGSMIITEADSDSSRATLRRGANTGRLPQAGDLCATVPRQKLQKRVMFDNSVSSKDNNPNPTTAASPDKLLQQPIDLSGFHETMPFSDAIDKLRKQTQPALPIVVMWNDLLENAFVEKASPIGFNGNGIYSIPVENGLNLLLHSAACGGFAPLRYAVHDNMILIATEYFFPSTDEEFTCNISKSLKLPASTEIEQKLNIIVFFSFFNKETTVKKTKSEAVRKQLDKTISLSGINAKMSFETAISWLRNQTQPQLPVVVIWSDLSENAFVEQDTAIGLDIGGIDALPISETLYLILQSVSCGGLSELKYRIDNGIIFIATKGGFMSNMSGNTSNISRDLKIPDSPHIQKMLKQSMDCSFLTPDTKLEEAIAQISKRVRPTLPVAVMWGDLSENAFIEKDTPINVSGGDFPPLSLASGLDILMWSLSSSGFAKISYFIEEDTLVITLAEQNCAYHFYRLKPAYKARLAAIKQQIDLSELSDKTSFEDAIQSLAETLKPAMKVKVLWDDLEKNAYIERDTPIRFSIENARPVSVDFALRLMLYSIESTKIDTLDYAVTGEELIIATKDTIAKMTNGPDADQQKEQGK